MRISTANAYAASIDTLTDRQKELYDAQVQMTTSKRVNRASDDPAAAARAERALSSMARADATQRAVDASETAMNLTESALSDAGDLLQQAREAVVAAGNATYTDAERLDQAKQLRQIRDQLLTIANRSDGSNNYLFGGQGTTQPPFVDAPGGVGWRSTAGDIKVAADESLPTSINGQAAWLQANSGNGVYVTDVVANAGGSWIDAGRVSNANALTGDDYQVVFDASGPTTTYSVMRNGAATAITGATFKSGQQIEIDGMAFAISGKPETGDTFSLKPSTPSLSVFDALDRAAAALETPLRSSAEITQANNAALRDIDGVMGKLAAARSSVGDTLNHIEAATGRLADAKLAAETENNNATGLDTVRALSDFENKQSSFDAALKSYSTVQKLSLFNYIS